ncbi:hypothetical protein J4433_01660 [Candidatus Pacearchaeota archaeon]|nr:hypothetical protein [Candidatus Pacearchaeota archaeon]
MKFNFRKITSVLASAVMIGSSIAVASAAAYPSPFIKSGAADVAIVIGASAATIDNIAAVDIASNLQAELAKQTATGGSASTSSTEESANLATTSQKIYLNSKLNDARTSLTKSELPTLLGNGKILDDAGTEYSYTQTLTLGSRAINYSTSGGDLNDPALLVEVGTAAENYLYQYVTTFNKNLNITHTDVQGNSIKIMGQDYTIGSGSTTSGTDKLVLFGAGTEKTLKEGETASIEIGGKTYSVQVSSIELISSVNYVSVSIDGSTVRRIAEGSSSKVGGLEVYAKTVHYLAKEAQVSYADLNIGSKKIILQHGSAVKQGSDETSIYGTEVDIDPTSDSLVSAVKVNVSMTTSTKDYIKAGESFVDPVFGGIKTQFVSVTPDLDAVTRDKVKIDTDNSRNAKVTFTSALAGEAGEKTIYFGHDDDDADTGIRTLLTDSANKTVHVVESDAVLINEYAVINVGDYGRIIKLTEVPTGDLDTTSKVQFEDVITGKNLFEGGLTVGTSGQATTNIDGNQYKFKVYNGSTSNASITWGAGATYGTNGTGTQNTIYPRIKLAKGGWIAILKPVTLSNSGTYSLPGIQTLADYETGLSIINNSNAASGYGSKKFGNVNYTIDFRGSTNNTIIGIDINQNDGSALVAGTDCLFNSTTENGAAILFIEEKKTSETGNADNGDAICVNVDKSGSTSPVEISVSTPLVTNIASPLTSLTSDSNLRRQVTRYGTFNEYDSTDNDRVTIKYPDEQMLADVVIATTSAEVSASTTGSAVAELGSVAVMDSEIDTVSSKNLIVVGGSCINTVAAKLLGSDMPICGADFTNKSGISADQFLIKVLDSPYATGKVAMLVAGYEGADTRKAVTYVTANKPATTVGTALKKQTATYADVV